MDHRPYDLVVYGATGFTGQYVAAEAVRTCLGKKIAIGGRNKAKLEKIIDFIKAELGDEGKPLNIGIIIADNSDNDSISEMCRQCRVVVNCVGPYTLYGEQVVRACVAMSTNYVDISGEPQFLQMCYIKYHEEAKAKGIHIVGACGFDSVPADVGLETLREKFPGELTSAESYIHLYGAGKANAGTYNSIIHAVSNGGMIKEQNKIIFKEKLPYVGPKLNHRLLGFARSENKWFIRFFGPDAGIVKRTQLHESSVFDKTPIQYSAYFTFQYFFFMFFMAIFGLYIFILSKFEFGVKLLTTYPRFFSFGVFSSDGVSKEDLYRSGFRVVFHGKGYSKKTDAASECRDPTQALSMKFSGPEPGYLYTSISLIASAATLLDDKLVNAGGVLTPGSAFRATKFIDRLQARGVKIEFF